MSNFRPISLSSAHAKLLELFLIPEDKAADVQFGFRKGGGTAMGCALLHDAASYFISANSPLYISSLDAEKCFDSLLHDGLFYKLYSVLPIFHWMLLVT